MRKGKQLRHVRHAEAPHSYQRGEGSRVQYLGVGDSAATLRARSLAWRKDARLRDDAVDVREG